MNVLIVEDSDDKYSKIVDLIGAVDGSAEIRRASNFVQALSELSKTKSVDVLILDIFLPMRAGDVPGPSVGLNILKEIVDGGSCCYPNHIICLSEFCGEGDEISEEIKSFSVHLVGYDPGSGEWIAMVRKKLEYVHRKIEDDAGTIPEYKCDLCIITASPQVEITALLELDVVWIQEYCPRSELVIYRSEWIGPSGPLEVVACEAPAMGMGPACATALKMIERETPRFLVMCGILAATDNDLSLGDIVVGATVYDYGAGKIVRSEDGERSFFPDPRQIHLDGGLRAIVKEWENEQRCMGEIGLEWGGRGGEHVPSLKLGVIASGAAVVQDSDLVEEIRNSSRKTVALDMEAYGIALAGSSASKPRPTVLIAKSVSDFADMFKDDSSQRLAAFTSARFIYHFFTTETLHDKLGGPRQGSS